MTEASSVQPHADPDQRTLVENEGVNAGSADATAEDCATGARTDPTGSAGGSGDATERPGGPEEAASGPAYAGAPAPDDEAPGQWLGEAGQDSGSMG